ncbi:Uncharacterised protein [Burkholderia pseudomallei]|nr:Uncharacterised protein [Burkholderia pseudomallei]CAJ4213888.1 Uncharacterised protein [Burkholderia pseudomallei]CAJ4664480.1 Uncharacterised protein [Burkholderia pseudomallei]CAJ6364116.1 Uncharacterised protein [Burkholderia pseudomallei]CAJ6883713.1 Uncharacterised protein [Burkholderia pseudomallei]
MQAVKQSLSPHAGTALFIVGPAAQRNGNVPSHAPLPSVSRDRCARNRIRAAACTPARFGAHRRRCAADAKRRSRPSTLHRRCRPSRDGRVCVRPSRSRGSQALRLSGSRVLGFSGSRVLGFSGSQALGLSGPRAIRFSGAASPAPPLSGSRTSRRSRDRFRPRAASRPSSRPARVRPARHSHFVGHARRQASARRMRRQPAETGRRRMFNAPRRPACPARASRAPHRSPSRRRARESG